MTRSWPFVPLLLLASVLVVHAADSGTKEVDAAWIAAMKANDVDAVMKCYAPDAIAALPDAPLAHGDKAIRATYEGLLSANTVTAVSISEMGSREAGNVATGWGTFSLTLTPKAGGSPATVTGRYTVVVERRGGQWVYVVDHASAEPAPAAGTKK
jgi:ketosteroid isomerase-like protein